MRQLSFGKMTAMAISDDDREFFVQLGARVAELRKAKNITQIQMAELLGVSQQTINSYEVGRRRIPVSALPTLATALPAWSTVAGAEACAARAFWSAA